MTISPADLRAIERALTQIGSLTHEMNQRVDTLQDHQVQTFNRVEALAAAFAKFVRDDAKHKQVQLAETRLVKVNQELETRFGHYAEVRRRATGILQAVDSRLVGADTIRSTTEDVMMKTPGYWLAPTLVALASWIRDDRPTADRALSEALRRDDYKASLFFSLVLRRLDRRGAARTWLGRYLMHQNPQALDREFVVLLDAVANGMFGPEAREVAAKTIETWLKELGDRAGFLEAQEKRWKTALEALTPTVPETEYRVLRKFSATWPALESTLRTSRLHARVVDYFRAIFEGEIVVSPQVSSEIDAILDRLVTHFDDEELPLRSEARRLQLISDAGGDVDVAQQRFDAEQKAFEEKVTFTELLTNASMTPELAKASRATQRFALALSRDWVASAHGSIAASARAAVPQEIALQTDDWSGQTTDGSNEEALLADQGAFFGKKEAEAVAQVKLPTFAYIAPVLGLLTFAFLPAIGAAIAVAAGAFYTFIEAKGLAGKRAKIRARVGEEKAKAAEVLRAALAEVVDYRADVNREDRRAEDVRTLLANISPRECTLVQQGDARAVLA